MLNNGCNCANKVNFLREKLIDIWINQWNKAFSVIEVMDSGFSENFGHILYIDKDNMSLNHIEYFDKDTMLPK